MYYAETQKKIKKTADQIKNRKNVRKLKYTAFSLQTLPTDFHEYNLVATIILIH